MINCISLLWDFLMKKKLSIIHLLVIHSTNCNFKHIIYLSNLSNLTLPFNSHYCFFSLLKAEKRTVSINPFWIVFFEWFEWMNRYVLCKRIGYVESDAEQSIGFPLTVTSCEGSKIFAERSASSRIFFYWLHFDLGRHQRRHLDHQSTLKTIIISINCTDN